MTGAARRPYRPRRGRAADGAPVVPDVEFTSYYGRPIVKPAPWAADIPAYLFLGGLAAGSSLLAAGADLTGRADLRRAGRLGGIGAITVSFGALVHDLGRPSRLLNMLRVAKPTSPMSMGTWLLTAYGPTAGLAGAAELAPQLPLPHRLRRAIVRSGRPAGIVAAGIAPAVAAYTAVLLADTAAPAWHEAYRELPFVFVGSAAGAAAGLALLTVPPGQTGPARRLAVLGVAVEIAADARMQDSMGLATETLRVGAAGRLRRAGQLLTGVGAAGAALLAGRSRAAAALSGVALLGGSACTRFAIFGAGQASARDPKYTVVPQHERLSGSLPSRSPGRPTG